MIKSSFFIFPLVAMLSLFGFPAQAQDGTVPSARGESSTPVSTPDPSGETAQPAQTTASDTPSAATSGAAAPRATTLPRTPTSASEQKPTVIVSPTLEPSAEPTIVHMPQPILIPEDPETAGFPVWILASAVLAALAGGFALKAKRKKNGEKKKEDGSRCFDIKKLLDEKVKELTDLRGQLESGAKGVAKEKLTEAIKGTAAGELLAAAQQAQKEVNRLKLLYEKCVVEFGEGKKRVIIVHGWDSYPDDCWFPWLKRELEQRGYEVLVPAMPEPDVPKIEAWVPHLADIAGAVDENTFFVGHSIGCQTILRYLERLPEGARVGGAVFVGGFYFLSELETEEEKIIGRPWMETPIDDDRVKRHTQKFFALFSDDDPVVPLGNKELFEQRLGARTAVEHGQGHFSRDDEVVELPGVVQALESF